MYNYWILFKGLKDIQQNQTILKQQEQSPQFDRLLKLLRVSDHFTGALYSPSSCVH